MFHRLSARAVRFPLIRTMVGEALIIDTRPIPSCSLKSPVYSQTTDTKMTKLDFSRLSISGNSPSGPFQFSDLKFSLVAEERLPSFSIIQEPNKETILSQTLYMDSTLKKRRRKMNKHKLQKRRKLDRRRHLND